MPKSSGTSGENRETNCWILSTSGFPTISNRDIVCASVWKNRKYEIAGRFQSCRHVG